MSSHSTVSGPLAAGPSSFVPGSPVANVRMYAVDAGAERAWKAIFGWVLARAGVRWPLIDHASPLTPLWAREDLGAVMMCGLPFALRTPRPVILAAPRPSPARYGGRAVYQSDIVVADGAPFASLEETFGTRVGYTTPESLSGAVAFRAHLAPYRAARGGGRLYRESVGGLLNPRGILQAVAEGRIDVGPVDSYCHDLFRKNEPGLAARVRTITSTAAVPIPPIVATASLDAAVVASLREAFLAVESAGELAGLREELLLSGFDVPEADVYDRLASAVGETAATRMDEL